MDATEVMPLKIDPLLIRRQHAFAAWHRSPADGRVVVKNRADTDRAVRPVKNFACARGTDFAPIDACELGMILRKEFAAAITVTAQPSASANSITCFSAPAARSLLPINRIGFCLACRNSAAAAMAARNVSGSLGSSPRIALIGPGAAQGADATLHAISI
jgi:hypothetical protein